MGVSPVAPSARRHRLAVVVSRDRGLYKLSVKTSSYARPHVNGTCARQESGTTKLGARGARAPSTATTRRLLDVDGSSQGAAEKSSSQDGKIYDPSTPRPPESRAARSSSWPRLGPVISKRLPDDIYIADECFFTGTAAEVTPIRELDGRTIGEGTAGPITMAIQKAFFDVVTGKDKKRHHWLTPVEKKGRK